MPLLAAAHALGIPLVYGSDAHGSAEVGRHRDRLTAARADLDARRDAVRGAP